MDWHKAFTHVVTTPPDHRQWIAPERALEILRCATPDLEALIQAGMPSRGGQVELFDVLNAGLYSGSQQSQPELELALLKRVLRAPVESWVAPVHHRVRAEASCPYGGGCDPTSTWSDPDLVDTTWTGRERGPGFARWEGEIYAHGTRTAIADPAIRAAWDEMLASYRYQYTPPGLRTAEAARERRVGDCAALSRLLTARLRARGRTAQVRQGFLLAGRIASTHQWAEVRDVDGALKPLDVSMAMLAPDFLTPQYAEFCLGSTMNRLLPAAAESTVAVRHECHGETARVVPQLIRMG